MLNIILDRLQKSKKIPKLPKGIVKPAIITGMEAIGRSQDFERLQMFVQTATALGAQTHLNMDEALSRAAASIGIDSKNLVKTQEQIQQEQQQAMQQQMMLQAVPNAVKGIADNANQQAAPAAPQG